MKPKIPLEKEISNKNMKFSEPEKKIDKNLEEKDKLIEKPKLIEKKIQEPKNSINRKASEVINAAKLEEVDYLEHPSPLVSDYEEEDKEEIKKDFYKNKEKEKLKNIEIYKSNYLDNNKIIYVCVTEKKEQSQKKSEISQKKCQSPIKKSVKMNLINKINNNISQPNKFSNMQNIEKENNDINKELSNKSEIKCIKEENSIEENIQLNKSVNKVQNLKKSENITNLRKDLTTKLKTIPVNKKSNSKSKGQKIIKKKMNLNTPIKKSVNKDLKEENNINKIPKNQTLKKIKINKEENIHKNSMSNTLVGECPIHKTINNGKTKIKINNNKNKSQIFSNNYNKYQNENNYEEISKNSANESIRKSHSFSKILINKNHNENYDYQLVNNNMNVISNENNSPKGNNIEMYQNNNLLNLVSSPINNSINSIQIKNQNHQNIDIYNDFQKVRTKIQHYSLPKNSNSNTNNKRRINNLHNNKFFYDRTFEQKENMQDNSQYKKQTYEVGGKFNNVQTTYVVISKNDTDSKLNLFPKNIKTIDYENNRNLYPNSYGLKTKTCRFLPPGRNVSFLNDSQNIYQNQSYQNFPPSYRENPNPKSSTYKGIIKMHKSHNNFNINNKCEFCQKQNVNKNNYYGNNYNNNLGSLLNENKALTITAADRNNNYLNNKPTYKETNTVDNLDNYYNYERRFDTEPYIPSPINKRYIY